MEVIHARCAGLDVHKKTVAACVRVAAEAAVATRGADVWNNDRELEGLAAWLRSERCTSR